MTAAKTGRIEELDILKAIGIICMVLGHSGSPVTRFIFLFHMPVFLAASGYSFKPSSTDTIRDVRAGVARKLKTLWLPFFLWAASFTLLHNVLLSLNLYTSDKAVLEYTRGMSMMNLTYSTFQRPLTAGGMLRQLVWNALMRRADPLVNTLWFIQTLFVVSVAYALADWFLKRVLRRRNPLAGQAVLSVLLLTLGRLCCLLDLPVTHEAARAASCYSLYFLGVLLRHFSPQLAPRLDRWRWPVLGASFLLLLLFYRPEAVTVDLAWNNYPGFFALPVLTLAGWGLCWSLACILKRTPLRRPMVFIGQRTWCVLVLHYSAFKLVTALVVAWRHLPAVCLATLPYLNGEEGLWWLVYTAVGLAVPLLLQRLYELGKKALAGRFPRGARGQQTGPAGQ